MNIKILVSVAAALLLSACMSELRSQPVQNPTNTSVEASVDDGRFATLNKMGWIINGLDEISSKFLDDLTPESKVLEIGAGFGFVSQKALEKGATVYVNDLDKRHLEIFKASVPEKHNAQVILAPGKFPNTFKIKAGSLDAILAQRVLHFLSPEEMDKGLKIMYDLLKDGGKVYVTIDSPYSKTWESFIPEYEMRKSGEERYPGLFKIKGVKTAQNLMDLDVAVKRFKEAGFTIEDELYLNNSSKFFNEIRLDGREAVGIIAYKKAKEEVSE
jgi:SAM-dependent methyltransferase